MTDNLKTALRPDEIFCIEAVASSIGGQWTEGENPPDAYLSIGNDSIAVEISTLTQHVVDPSGGSKPRRSEDTTATRLCNELDRELFNSIPPGRTVLLILSAPITSARKLKPKLSKEILTLVENAGLQDVSVEREILGNTITIHHFLEDRPSGKKIIGGIQNEKSSADILANAKVILRDRISVKSLKCNSLTQSGPIWLVLLNDYWLADTETYLQALSQISVEHPFDRILIVSGNKCVAVLHENHNKRIMYVPFKDYLSTYGWTDKELDSDKLWGRISQVNVEGIGKQACFESFSRFRRIFLRKKLLLKEILTEGMSLKISDGLRNERIGKPDFLAMVFFPIQSFSRTNYMGARDIYWQGISRNVTGGIVGS